MGCIIVWKINCLKMTLQKCAMTKCIVIFHFNFNMINCQEFIKIQTAYLSNECSYFEILRMHNMQNYCCGNGKKCEKNHGKSCNIAKKSCCYGKVYLSKKKYFPSLHIVNLKRLLLVVEIIFIPECRKMDYRDRVENCK